jgi:hypothetical protein
MRLLGAKKQTLSTNPAAMAGSSMSNPNVHKHDMTDKMQKDILDQFTKSKAIQGQQRKGKKLGLGAK